MLSSFGISIASTLDIKNNTDHRVGGLQVSTHCASEGNCAKNGRKIGSSSNESRHFGFVQLHPKHSVQYLRYKTLAKLMME
jgi:hypothetical protein